MLEEIYCIKVDEEGFFLEPVFVEVEIDEDGSFILPDYHYLPYSPEQVFHRPKINFETGEWEEGLTTEEINELINRPKEPTELELLEDGLATLVEEVFDFKVTYNSVPCQAHQDYPALIEGLVNPKEEEPIPEEGEPIPEEGTNNGEV